LSWHWNEHPRYTLAKNQITEYCLINDIRQTMWWKRLFNMLMRWKLQSFFYKCRFCVWTDAINLIEMANVIIAEFRDT
jgi:hypothetical protein